MQLSGSWTAEVDENRLARKIAEMTAELVLERLHGAAREATGGESEGSRGAHAAGEGYERPEAGR